MVQYYDFTLDYIESIFYKKPVETKKVIKQNCCVIKFCNKGFNKLGLPGIFQDETIKELLPDSMKEDHLVPFPTFKLDAPIRNKIFNYKDTVNSVNLQIDEEVSFVSNLPACQCSKNTFRDSHHNHVVTGDLRIIKNSKLRNLLSKGPSYRPPKTLNFKNCRKSIYEGLNSSISRFCKKYKLLENSLANWRDGILNIVDKKIEELKKTNVPQKVSSVLQNPGVLADLEELHSKYVIVPIDKASKNVANICKRYYINAILEELGFSENRSATYSVSNFTKEQIIDQNNKFCKKILKKDLADEQKTLPIIYWMPKMHYTPSRRRFIIASGSCSTKPISSVMSKIFKHIFRQIENFHDRSYFYKNYNMFWVIQNSAPFLNKMNDINIRRGAKDISTYDFSTLYTKLPHDDLLRVLNLLVDFVFDCKNLPSEKLKKYITVTEYKTYWSKKKYGENTFTKTDVKTMLSHLILQCNFQFENKVFLQTIGIPMGIDPAPFWANLYLYFYEKNYIMSVMKNNTKKALMFRNASRFIDDEVNLNDRGEFGASCREIYPTELELKVEHQGDHATFLELDISIQEGCYIYKLFDKRDDFPFSIVRMPDIHGNIPNNIFYGSVMAEILRIARASLLYKDFVTSMIKLLTRMKNQGGVFQKLHQQIKKAIGRYPHLFSKYNKHVKDIIFDTKF